jgi:hypothetical protein
MIVRFILSLHPVAADYAMLVERDGLLAVVLIDDDGARPGI